MLKVIPKCLTLISLAQHSKSDWQQ